MATDLPLARRAGALSAITAAMVVMSAVALWRPGPSGASPLHRPAAPEHLRSGEHTATYTKASSFRANGYAYRFTIDLAIGEAKAGDSTSLPPSQSAIYVPASGTLTITNRTPGRDAPIPLGMAAAPVDALWRTSGPGASTPLCMPNATFMAGVPDALHEKLGQTWYCLGAVLFDIEDNFDTKTVTGDLAPGQTITETLAPTGCQSAKVNNFSCPSPTPTGDDVVITNTSSLRAAVHALNVKPAAVLAYLAIGSYVPGTDVCTPGGSSSGYGSYAWVVSSRSHLPSAKC